jgi:hypothetical protein
MEHLTDKIWGYKQVVANLKTKSMGEKKKEKLNIYRYE